MATEVNLPHNWRPRSYQMPLWTYFENGGKRAYMVAHRRWGKDDVCLHRTACAAIQRPGNYWHMLPESTQGRKAIWDAINPHTGIKRIDEAFPMAIRKRTVDDEMKIEFRNGALWQVLGSDNYNSYMGSPPVGVVFSEWALSNPQAWPYIQPILEENGGWAFFITTPRGHNHAKTFFDVCSKRPDEWFCARQGASETGVFTHAQLQKIRMDLIQLFGHHEGEARFLQEYMVSFDAAMPGAYYGREMNEADVGGRISGVPYDPAHPVIAIFDFGRGQSNATSITFVQTAGLEPHIIDYYEDSSGNIPAFAKMLKEKPYTYSHLVLPHDGKPDRLATGISYAKQFENFGFVVKVLPMAPDVGPEINITRQFISMCWFDKTKTARLLDCLRSYHREWDATAKIFKSTPKHDWSSHGADSFRYTAVAHKLGWLVPETQMQYADAMDDFAMTSDDRSNLTGY